MAINSVNGGVGITATTVAGDVTVSVNQAANLAWTGKQSITRFAADAPNGALLQLASLKAGGIPNGNGIIDVGYNTALDVRRTSNLTTDLTAANQAGGLAAMYVQHVVSGNIGTTPKGSASVGLRVSLDTTQGGTIDPNDAVAVYSSVSNRGAGNCVAYAYHADVDHNVSTTGAEATASFGYVAESFRTKTAGSTVLFHARLRDKLDPNGQPILPDNVKAEAGFLCSRVGAVNRKFEVGFGIGSALYAGTKCDYAFDAAYADVLNAAVRIPTGSRIRLSGTDAAQADVLYTGGSAKRVEFRNSTTYMLALPMDTNTISLTWSAEAVGCMAGSRRRGRRRFAYKLTDSPSIYRSATSRGLRERSAVDGRRT